MVDFTTTVESSELVADLLWSMGVVAIEERSDVADVVTLRTSMGDEPQAAITAVCAAFPDIEAAVIGVARSVADTWREHATPTWVTESIALVPAWVTTPKNATSILIEPLDTFGLGNHPTTVLALRLALQYIDNNAHIIDVGCGSGVLAIALAKLKNCSAVVFDIAESARGAVQQNALLNDVSNVEWIDHWQTAHADAVVANILAPVLKAEAESIENTLSSKGLIVLSGMRDEQVADVLGHYRHSHEVGRETMDGWTAVVLSKG